MAFEQGNRLDSLTNSLACFYASMSTAEELRDRMSSAVLAEAGVEFSATVYCEPGTYLALMPRSEDATATAIRVGLECGYGTEGGEPVEFSRHDPLKIARITGQLSTRGTETVELITGPTERGDITLVQLPNIRSMRDYNLVPTVDGQEG